MVSQSPRSKTRTERALDDAWSLIWHVTLCSACLHDGIDYCSEGSSGLHATREALEKVIRPTAA